MLELSAFDIVDGVNTIRYENGYDYFFLHFKDIIDTLHESIDLPIGIKKNALSTLHPAILSYGKADETATKNTFQIKNVCTTPTCKESKITPIPFHTTTPIVILSGVKTPRAEFDESVLDIRSETFHPTSYEIAAGESVGVDVEFDDYLSDFSQKYKYTLIGTYMEGNGGSVEVSEEFFVKKRILEKKTATRPEKVEYRIYQNGVGACTPGPYTHSEAYEERVDDQCFRELHTIPIEVT